MSQLGVILQEALRSEREARTIVGFLRAKMERLDREGRRRNLKERLGFTGMGCCGATWGCRATAISVGEEDEDDELQQPADQPADPYSNHTAAPSAMNLAAALAAERRLRSSPQEVESEVEGVSMSGEGRESGTAGRVSLMRLLEESEGGEKEGKREDAEGSDSVCCVCMGRKKGAAFIPCGHTFCRVCSRELWLNRGSCPLCNRWILEILDIF